MKLNELIAGLEILRKYYYDGGDGYHVYAEHDTICTYQTDKPMSPDDVQKNIQARLVPVGRPGYPAIRSEPGVEGAFMKPDNREQDIAALVDRLRAHAHAHEYIADSDDEQRQWMADLYDAADALSALDSAG